MRLWYESARKLAQECTTVDVKKQKRAEARFCWSRAGSASGCFCNQDRRAAKALSGAVMRYGAIHELDVLGQPAAQFMTQSKDIAGDVDGIGSFCNVVAHFLQRRHHGTMLLDVAVSIVVLD